MTFVNFEFLLLFLLIPLYFFKYKFTKDMVFLFLSFSFVVLALSRPIIYSNIVDDENLDIEFVIALDVSKSMIADDIKPNRFEFAKNKIEVLTNKLKNEKVSLLGFSNQSFIIIPKTNDYEVFKFLTKNLSIDKINKNGTDFTSILKASDEVLSSRSRKFVILFTDGGEDKNFEKQIEYAKENNIVVNVYNIGTLKGSAIRYEEELIKDSAGNIVLSKLNESIRTLSDKTNGVYLKYSLKDNDMDLILNDIKNKATKNFKENNLENRNEMFYFPLIMAFIFFMLARFDGFKKMNWSLK